jgi:hypothetical protein
VVGPVDPWMPEMLSIELLCRPLGSGVAGTLKSCTGESKPEAESRYLDYLAHGFCFLQRVVGAAYRLPCAFMALPC